MVISQRPTMRDSSGVRSSPRMTRFATPWNASVCARGAIAGAVGLLVSFSIVVAPPAPFVLPFPTDVTHAWPVGGPGDLVGPATAGVGAASGHRSAQRPR